MRRPASNRNTSPFAALEKRALTTMPQQQTVLGQAASGIGNQFGGAAKIGLNVLGAPLHMGASAVGGAASSLASDTRDVGAGLSQVSQGNQQVRGGLKALSGGSWGGLQGLGGIAKGVGNQIGGGARAAWNTATMPVSALASGVGGAFNAAKTDLGDMQAGAQQIQKGNQQLSASVRPPVAQPPVAPQRPITKFAFSVDTASYGRQSPRMSNAGSAGRFPVDTLSTKAWPLQAGPAPAGGYPAKPEGPGLSALNKWIGGDAGPQMPGRPQSVNAPAAKPSKSFAPSTPLGVDTPSGKGMRMTGPGSGFNAGVPAIGNEPQPLPTPAPAADVDLSKEFRKYHDTRFNPKSDRDKDLMSQMQELYRQNGGKLTSSLVYGKQYGTKSASVTAFASLEKAAFNPTQLIQKGLGWGSKALRIRSGAAKTEAADLAAKAFKPAPLPAPSRNLNLTSQERAMTPARVAVGNANAGRLKEVREAANASVGNKREGLAGWLDRASHKLDDSVGLQRGLDYGLPAVAGAGALYGAGSIGHGMGRDTGMSDGWDARAAAEAASAPEQEGYLGNLWNAVSGQQPTDAASMRAMLDSNKSNILQSILSGRA